VAIAFSAAIVSAGTRFSISTVISPGLSPESGSENQRARPQTDSTDVHAAPRTGEFN
jgi:hypothetical protein